MSDIWDTSDMMRVYLGYFQWLEILNSFIMVFLNQKLVKRAMSDIWYSWEMMGVYSGLFFLNSLIGLKLVEFICVVVLNLFMLCENLIKLN